MKRVPRRGALDESAFGPLARAQPPAPLHFPAPGVAAEGSVFTITPVNHLSIHIFKREL